MSWSVQALRQLEVLFIPGTFLSERGLQALAGLPRLQTLGLECFAEGSPSYLSMLSCLTQLTALQVSLGAPLPDWFGDCWPARRSCQRPVDSCCTQGFSARALDSGCLHAHLPCVHVPAGLWLPAFSPAMCLRAGRKGPTPNLPKRCNV